MKISKDEFFKRIETIYDTFPHSTILETNHKGGFKLCEDEYVVFFGLPYLYFHNNFDIETNALKVSIWVNNIDHKEFHEDEFEEFSKLANQAVDIANKISDILHA